MVQYFSSQNAHVFIKQMGLFVFCVCFLNEHTYPKVRAFMHIYRAVWELMNFSSVLT